MSVLNRRYLVWLASKRFIAGESSYVSDCTALWIDQGLTTSKVQITFHAVLKHGIGVLSCQYLTTHDGKAVDVPFLGPTLWGLEQLRSFPQLVWWDKGCECCEDKIKWGGQPAGMRADTVKLKGLVCSARDEGWVV